MNNKIREIGGRTSIMLDSLRIAAALTVLIFHGFEQWFPQTTGANSVLGNAAHTAVIVFFVLSGYLIAYSAAKTAKLSQYLVSRLSRLCSVVIPALFITIIVQLTIARINPGLLSTYTRGTFWPRYLISASFINEIWFFSAAPPLNSPLWSLSFEFWYYIIFGLWFYAKKENKKMLLPIVACLIAGPKILILMPIWLLGNAAFNSKRPEINDNVAWIFIIIALLLALLVMLLVPPFPHSLGTPPLFFASQFITDYLAAVFVALALWLLPLDHARQNGPRWIKWYRMVSDLTFPLYLLHFPLLLLCLAIIYQYNEMYMWMSILIVLIICFVLGYLMESKRILWIKFFKWQFAFFERKHQDNKV